MVVEGFEVHRRLHHLLQLDEASRELSEFGRVSFVQRVPVHFVHDALQRAEKARQADGHLISSDDVLEVGLVPLESLGQPVEIGHRLEMLFLHRLPEFGVADKSLDQLLPLLYFLLVHQGLLQPLRQQPAPQWRLAVVQQAVQAHGLGSVPSAGHQIEGLESGSIQLHVLREVMLVELVLAEV